jgi:integrase
MRLTRALDAYDGDMARRGRSPESRRHYRHDLAKLADLFDPEATVDEITLAHYERFLDRWTNSQPSTLAGKVSMVRGFSEFLWKRGLVETHVALPLERPKRKRPEDLEVKTISAEDVARMLDCCFDWQELLCLATLAYTGARRQATSRARRRDVDLTRRTIRLFEKGGKVAVKRIADEYLAILAAAEADGVWAGPKDYLVPSRRPASVRRSERSDKVIWDTVKTVAARAGVDSHCHAFRAAFAVQYDEQHPGLNFELKDLMGHSRIETTLIYLRRKRRDRAMDTVADLSWGHAPGAVRTRVTGLRSPHPGPLDDGGAFESSSLDESTRLEPVPPP